MTLKNPKFVEILKERNLLPEREINRTLKQNNHDTYQLLLHVIKKGILTKEKAGKMYGEALNVTWLNLDVAIFRPEIVSRLPKEFSEQNNIILLFQMGKRITAAMADPLNQNVIREAEKLAGEKLTIDFAFKEDIQDAVEVQYKSVYEIEELIKNINVSAIISPDKEISASELEKIAGNEAIVDLTRSIMLLAIKEGASDIHIQPTEDLLSVRFRVDGVMHERVRLTKDILAPLLSRIKILANMNITEHRRPQDGHIGLKLSNKSIDFRVSTTPTIYGEKSVLRVLGEAQIGHVPDLEELYLSKSIFEKVKMLIKTPNGVFFITGPTGSGKTTTLFSSLKFINNPEINIITVEDPVEYRLPGISQTQINREVGLGFETTLRSVLRQDPDVILIGEIRDLETAKIATEAALTGHLVLSTLHTNNAIQAVTRLVEIGVEPFIVGPSIIGVLSQRLVRKICEDCKESYSPPPDQIDKIFLLDGKQEVKFFRGKGCSSCKGTGYKGRIAIHEMVLVDDNLRELVTKNSSNMELRKAAKKSGYQTMRYDGIKKVLRGLTTIDEINRVTFPVDLQI